MGAEVLALLPLLGTQGPAPWWADPGFWLSSLGAALLGILVGIGILLLIPRTRQRIAARFMGVMAEAYQRQLSREFRRKFPALFERFAGFRFTGESQAALMAAMKRIPPQEGMKLQTEFMRLSENFQHRHPELQAFLAALRAQDARGQAKALQGVFRLPEAKRQAISKDLLWAYDQLTSRFPRWVKMLEATLRGPAAPAEVKTPEPAGKKQVSS